MALLPNFLPVLIFVVLASSFFLRRYLAFISPPLPLPPTDEVVSLRIYPIKSCRGITVKSAQLLRTGFDLDRNWMFISCEKGEFVTLRAKPEMTLINTAIDAAADELMISIQNREHRLVIPAHPTSRWLEDHTRPRKVIIWGEETDAWEYAASLSQPFSDFLDMDVRLVYKGPTPRVLRGSGASHILGRTEAIKFPDMMPIQVSSMASMAELNERLRREGEEELAIERFRPNIIVRGHKPWNEDGWRSLLINGDGRSNDHVALDVVCRCLRCHVPNVDPDTANKHPRQPWKELMKYRRIDEGFKYKPSFGMLCAPRNEGLVQVGMKFEVTSMTNEHTFINPMK